MAHHESHAHGNDHPFHLVNPSPWPILSALSLLLMAVGGVLFMHEHAIGKFLLIPGLMGVLGCMYGWWRDVINEGVVEKAHTPAVSHGLRWGMILFITSEVMFFVAFFWAFFEASLFPKLPLEDVWAMAKGAWPPAGIETFDPWHIPFLNTLILLLSGTTVTWAHHAVLHDRRDEVITALWCTVLLGLTFTGFQAYEYIHATFKFKDGVYASTFYMATGFHGFHVIVGTIFLAVNLVNAYKGRLTADKHLGFEFAAWYWHFVDVVWLFLFVSVYWWGGQ